MITKNNNLKTKSILAALDIGSSKIACVVGRNNSQGIIEILGYEFQSTKSVKKGLISDLSTVEREIKDIVDSVAKKTNTEISNVIVNTNIVNSKSNFLKGVTNIDNQKIDDFHIKTAINNSEIFKYDEEFETLHKIINYFDVDKEKKINNPKNLFANLLSVYIYQILVKKNYLKSIKAALSNINLNVERFVASPFASSLATLINEEKDLGTISIDLGSGTTSVSIIENNKLIFAGAIPVGSNNITYDIVSGLTTSFESAERLKTLYGSVFSNPSDEHELIDVPVIGSNNDNFNQINRSNLNSFIKPRVEETLELIRQKLKEHNLHNKKYRRVVLTGGGSLLEGIDEYARIIFDSQVRVGKPSKFIGIDEKINKPQFSTVLGLLLIGNETKLETDNLLSKEDEKIEKMGVFKSFSRWLDLYI